MSMSNAYNVKEAIKLLRLVADWAEKMDVQGICLPELPEYCVSNTRKPEPELEELVKELRFRANRLEHPSYVTVIHGIGGYNSCLMTWDEECNMYTPWQTGFTNTSLGTGLEKDAIQEAKGWADDEAVEYRYT